MTADTNTFQYWCNWRFFLCAFWVFLSMVFASVLIWKYEGSSTSNHESENQQETAGTIYKDEAWKPCLKEVHPAWLLAFRIIAFFVMLTLLVVNVVVDGGSIFYYYTQWTFALVTIYFGLGSVLSSFGCHQFIHKVTGVKVDQMRLDAERGTYVAPIQDRNEHICCTMKNSGYQEEPCAREIAGISSYVFQIIYQMSAGAVLLTDFVFWFIIVPFLTIKDYNLTFILVGMHSINAVFLIGDTALNCLRFPWFRISYFLLWTAVYVIFQWIIHACISIWWPYPFLELSSPYSPICVGNKSALSIDAVHGRLLKLRPRYLNWVSPNSRKKKEKKLKEVDYTKKEKKLKEVDCTFLIGWVVCVYFDHQATKSGYMKTYSC